MVDICIFGHRFKRQQKADSIFLVKTVGSEIEFSRETGRFNTLLYGSEMKKRLIDKVNGDAPLMREERYGQ